MRQTIEDVYTPEVLRKLQNVELEILTDFIQLCEKHDLKYFGMAKKSMDMGQAFYFEFNSQACYSVEKHIEDKDNYCSM